MRVGVSSKAKRLHLVSRSISSLAFGPREKVNKGYVNQPCNLQPHLITHRRLWS